MQLHTNCGYDKLSVKSTSDLNLQNFQSSRSQSFSQTHIHKNITCHASKYDAQIM